MRVGIELGKEDLRKEGGDEKARLAYYPANPLSPTELLHIINTLLPLVYQIIYSKHQGERQTRSEGGRLERSDSK